MKQLSSNDILGADDLKKEKVDCPEWDGFVYVSEMSGFMRDQFELAFAGAAKEKSKGNMRATYASYTVVDDKGDLLFTADQLDALGKKNAAALDRIFDMAEKLNHIYTSVEDEAKK